MAVPERSAGDSVTHSIYSSAKLSFQKRIVDAVETAAEPGQLVAVLHLVQGVPVPQVADLLDVDIRDVGKTLSTLAQAVQESESAPGSSRCPDGDAHSVAIALRSADALPDDLAEDLDAHLAACAACRAAFDARRDALESFRKALMQYTLPPLPPEDLVPPARPAPGERSILRSERPLVRMVVLALVPVVAGCLLIGVMPRALFIVRPRLLSDIYPFFLIIPSAAALALAESYYRKRYLTPRWLTWLAWLLIVDGPLLCAVALLIAFGLWPGCQMSGYRRAAMAMAYMGLVIWQSLAICAFAAMVVKLAAASGPWVPPADDGRDLLPGEERVS